MANIAELSRQLNEQKLKVDYDSFDFSVKELITLVNDGTINIAPDYQRKFRWEEERQSLLIESIFLGIPVPPIYMATNVDASWEVIDGLQRLSTIINFVAEEDSEARRKINKPNRLVLKDLKKLSNFNGADFNDLPRTLQLSFVMKPLKVITLSDKSDFSVRFDLFQRLNTGGIKLTDQEIRSCVYQGRFNDLLKSLSQDQNFRKSIKLQKSKTENGTWEELVLRFFSYLNYRNNFVHNVTDFLNEYMSQATRNFNYENDTSLFMKTFEELSQLQFGIVKSPHRNITSIIFFEAVSVGAAEALRNREHINLENFYEWVKDPNFNRLVTGATNTRNRVLERIEYCKNMFLR